MFSVQWAELFGEGVGEETTDITRTMEKYDDLGVNLGNLKDDAFTRILI